MPTPIYELAPVISFDQSLAANSEVIDVDYERLQFALGRTGVAGDIANDTAVHFTNLGFDHPRFGIHRARSRIDRLVAKGMDINRQLDADGFRAHQLPYGHKIVLNIYDGVGKDIKNTMQPRLESASSKYLRGMTSSDWLSVALGHEFIHCIEQHKRGFKRRNTGEDQVDAHLNELIGLGVKNPWRGVIRLTPKH